MRSNLVSFADYAAARDAARRSRRGETLYPRLLVLDNAWYRQDYADGALERLSNADADRLLNPEVA